VGSAGELGIKIPKSRTWSLKRGGRGKSIKKKKRMLIRPGLEEMKTSPDYGAISRKFSGRFRPVKA